MERVTDPKLLEMLNTQQQQTGPSAGNKVLDPELLNVLNTPQKQPEPPKEIVPEPSSEPSVLDNIVGGLEVGTTLLTGMAAEPISGLYGLTGYLARGADFRGGVSDIESAQEALTYQPRTQAGQAQLQAVGEAIQPVAETAQAALQRLGDFAMDKTGSVTATAAATALPVLLAEIGGLKAIKKAATLTPKQIEVRRLQKEMLLDNVEKNNENVAAVKLSPTGSVVRDKTGEEMLDLGIPGKTTATITNASPETKKIMEKMLNTFEKGSSNDVYALTAGMSDELGKSVTKRLAYLQGRRKAFGKRLDSFVNGPAGKKQIDVSEPMNKFLGEMARTFDVKPRQRPDGTFVLPSDKQLEGTALGVLTPVKKLYRDTLEIYNQKVVDGVTTVKDAHKLKKLLDELADVNKASESGFKAAGHQRILALRSDLNRTLRESSSEYGKINQNLSNMIEAMSPFDKYVSKGKSWDSEDLNKIVGSAMRNLSSDATATKQLRTDIGNLEAAVRRTGVNFKDDPRALAVFKDFVDNYFSINPETLNRQLGNIDAAMAVQTMDLATSLAIGNKFATAHDIAQLTRLGLSKKKATQIATNKQKAKQAIKKALKE